MKFSQTARPADGTIIGPYSRWSPKKPGSRRKVVLYSGGILTSVAFVHCVLPMLLAA